MFVHDFNKCLFKVCPVFLYRVVLWVTFQELITIFFHVIFYSSYVPFFVLVDISVWFSLSFCISRHIGLVFFIFFVLVDISVWFSLSFCCHIHIKQYCAMVAHTWENLHARNYVWLVVSVKSNILSFLVGWSVNWLR